MLKLEVVEACPHTVTGRGNLRLDHNIITVLAGAVEEKEEWIALLIGTRNADGLTICVEDLQVPKQYRGQVTCGIEQAVELLPHVVGVVHSHHSMAAVFSTTDTTTLNPRFPVSLVIAQDMRNTIEEMLGFSYEAVGRAPLPCGAMGIVPFTIVPNPVVEGWPETITVGYHQPGKSTFEYCPFVAEERVGSVYKCSAKCGATGEEKAVAIFGKTGDEFIAEVVKNTTRYEQLAEKREKHTGYPVTVNDERHRHENDTFLRHWSVQGD